MQLSSVGTYCVLCSLFNSLLWSPAVASESAVKVGRIIGIIEAQRAATWGMVGWSAYGVLGEGNEPPALQWSPGRPTVFVYFKCSRWLLLLHYWIIYARSWAWKWGIVPLDLQVGDRSPIRPSPTPVTISTVSSGVVHCVLSVKVSKWVYYVSLFDSFLSCIIPTQTSFIVLFCTGVARDSRECTWFPFPAGGHKRNFYPGPLSCWPLLCSHHCRPVLTAVFELNPC